MREKYYTIGEVSNICKVTSKALRFYEEIGLISPDRIGKNNYRYYTRKTMLLIPIIKYYKTMGFTLDEMRDLIQGASYGTLLNHFSKKVHEFEKQEAEIRAQKIFVTDWYNLISEAQYVIENDITDVSVRFLKSQTFLSMPYTFTGDYREATLSIEFTNYVDALENKITGPVMLWFPVQDANLLTRKKDGRIIQEPAYPVPQKNSWELQQGMFATTYHIGSQDSIECAYRRLADYLEESHYLAGDYCIERLVTDYWTSPQVENHVTEILLPIKKEKKT